jgi:hypothetical protein
MVIRRTCSTCGLPFPDGESTLGPERPFVPGEPIVCLLDHGPPTLVERWRARRAARATHAPRFDWDISGDWGWLIPGAVIVVIAAICMGGRPW